MSIRFNTLSSFELVSLMDRHLKPHYDKLHEALGSLVREWAWLEHAVSGLIFDLAAISSKAFYEDHDIGAFYTAVASNIDLRAASAIARGLAFASKDETNQFDDIEAALNLINNELRNLRNRYVHDQWMVAAHDRIVKFQKGTKLPREAGSGERTLSLTTHEHFSSVTEIEAVVTRVHNARIWLNRISDDLQEVYRRKYPDAEL